jgi:ABC-type methionine transport system permease subunit
MEHFFSMIFGCVIGALLGVVITSSQSHQIKKEAVKRGAAIWQVDENGTTTFTWK